MKIKCTKYFYNLQCNISNYIEIFSLLFLFGFLINGFTFLKYIGLYGAIIFFMIDVILHHKHYISTIYYIYNHNKLLSNTFLLLILTLLISCIFPYYSTKSALNEFEIEFLNIGIFFIISIAYIKNVNYLLYTILLSFALLVIKFGYEYYIHSHFNFSIRLDRIFSTYFEFIYPFILVSFLYIKNIYAKIIISIFLILGFLELILTGARGSWGSVSIETFLIFLFIFINNKKNRKILLYIFLLFITFFITLGIYFFNNSSLIKNKIDQGFNPNGRIQIIENRLPIFLKYQNYIIGIGGIGNSQYEKFLSEHHAPKEHGKIEKNKFIFYSDEPFLLQIFYKYGIMGLFFFSLFSIIFIIKCTKSSTKSNYYLFIATATSYIGFYLVRGLFELRDFKHLVILFALFLIFKDKNKIETL